MEKDYRLTDEQLEGVAGGNNTEDGSDKELDHIRERELGYVDIEFNPFFERR